MGLAVGAFAAGFGDEAPGVACPLGDGAVYDPEDAFGALDFGAE